MEEFRTSCELISENEIGSLRNYGRAAMGEMIEFPSNGSTAGRLPGRPGGRQRARRRRDPGVVGPGRPHQGRLRPLRRGGFVALAPDLYHGQKVPPGEPDEAGKAMMACRWTRPARDMSGAVDEVLAPQLGRPRRRHRVLHGRRARARAGHAAPRRGGGRRAVLRHHPVARRAARLRARCRPPCSGTTPRRTTSSRPRRPTRWATQLRGPGQVGRDHHLSRCRPRVLQRHAPRGLRRRRVAARCGSARWRSSASIVQLSDRALTARPRRAGRSRRR